VFGTRKWVGTTEVVSLLRHYGIRANIVGFKTDSQAAKDAYGQRFIFDWVWDYFTGGCAVRCGVVWCGVVWCGVVWCGVVRCGVVWCGAVRCGVVLCGAVWCGQAGRGGAGE
jgi:hypothetical protein